MSGHGRAGLLSKSIITSAAGSSIMIRLSKVVVAILNILSFENNMILIDWRKMARKRLKLCLNPEYLTYQSYWQEVLQRGFPCFY
jgi:hypothetical protein